MNENTPRNQIIADATAAQHCASDPHASVWVGASAGSGKTKVLTDRILRLLLDGALPERLMCVTYTRAGAAEMKIRLNKRLSEWSVMSAEKLQEELTGLLGRTPTDAESREARRLFARVADAPGGLTIETIHAFCQSLLKRFPVEAGVSPGFTLLDEVSQAEMLSAARDDVLLAARDERRRAEQVSGMPAPLAQAVEYLTARMDENSFADALKGITSRRRDFEEFRREVPGTNLSDVSAHVLDRFGVPADKVPANLIRDAMTEGPMPALVDLHEAAELIRLHGTPTENKRAEGLRKLVACETVADRVEQFDDYKLFLLTQKEQPRQKSAFLTAKAKKALGERLTDMLLAEQERICTLLAEIRQHEMALQTAALLTIGVEIIRRYQAAKSRRAQLDYDDLILRTVDLLSEPGIPPWVMYRLDGGLDHLLIDEAQDTSPAQWQVMEKLTTGFFERPANHGSKHNPPRTIFVVGDKKQSIFSFQGADPAEFDRMRRWFSAQVEAAAEIAREEGHTPHDFRAQPMDVSFRTVPAVLALVDRVFADDLAAQGVADGIELQHVAARQQQPGRIELWPLVPKTEKEDDNIWDLPPILRRFEATADDDGSEEDAGTPPSVSPDPRQQLATAIAGRMKQLIDSGEVLPSTGLPIRAGDMMVLLRARTGGFMEHLVRALKQLDIPVAGVDRSLLTESLPVQDLIALSRFVLQRDDDLTLAEILRSPFVDLPEDVLYDLAAERDKSQSLFARITELAEAGNAQITALRNWLRDVLSRADRMPPYEFFAAALRLPCPASVNGSGLAALLTRLGRDAAEPVAEFLQLAIDYQTDHIPSLELFTRWFRQGGNEVKRENDAAANEVRILTVHGSKGLEAPIVFLPDMTRGGAPRGSTLLWPEDVHAPGGNTLDSALAHMPVFAARSEFRGPEFTARNDIVRERQEQEYRRLLYVALTRAEDQLYICGRQTRDSDLGCDPKDWYGMSRKGLEQIEDMQDVPAPACLPWAETMLVWSTGDATTEAHPAPATSQDSASDTPAPDWLLAPLPAEPAPVRPLSPSRPSQEDPAPRSPAGSAEDAGRFKRGLILHRLLELLPTLPDDQREAAAKAFLATPAHELSEHVQKDWLAEILTVLDHPDFAPLFNAAGRAEVPIVGLIGNEPVSGEIDRLVEMGDDVWIIDYKTNRPPPTRVEDVPRLYFRQLGMYRAILAPLYPNQTIRCALLWTDGPNLMELPSDRLESALPDAHRSDSKA
ncbi:MAG: double-strand break repair helicase AddA [Alphaproteobacteria bacterium]